MTCIYFSWRGAAFQLGEGPAFGWSTFLSSGGPDWAPAWGWFSNRKGVYEIGLGVKWPSPVRGCRRYLALFIEP